MARIEKLSEDELRNELDTLDGWSLQNGKLQREFQFQDFNEASAGQIDDGKSGLLPQTG